MSTSCSVFWCPENSREMCFCDDEDTCEPWHNDPWCECCDFIIEDGSVIDVRGVDDVEGAMRDCELDYIEFEEESDTVVFKRFKGAKSMRSGWVAVRASKEFADALYVFPNTDGGVSAELRNANQTELELGV